PLVYVDLRREERRDRGLERARVVVEREFESGEADARGKLRRVNLQLLERDAEVARHHGRTPAAVHRVEVGDRVQPVAEQVLAAVLVVVGIEPAELAVRLDDQDPLEKLRATDARGQAGEAGA